MNYKKLLLKEIDKRFTDETATLRIYISERNESVIKRPGMLVCPGGGYSFCSAREAEPIAFRFLSEGFNCFILDYTVNHKYPAPHLELAAVIAYIRNHEKEFDLIPNSLSIIGFSAGGHLVGSYGYLYKELAKELNVKESLLRPFSIVMAYPVITKDTNTHEETFEIISQGDKKLIEKMNINRHVTKDYPPTFLWTTKDDDLVPYENTVVMGEALEKQKVHYQMKIYRTGWHGGSLVNRSCTKAGDIPEGMKEVRYWASDAADFIYDLLDK